MQSIISTCEMKDPEGLRWKRWGSAADAEDLNESGDGVDGETEAESGESAFSTTGRVVYPQTLQDIAKYQQEGEDLAWHNEPDPERCKETQSLILRRKHQGPDTTRYFNQISAALVAIVLCPLHFSNDVPKSKQRDR